MESRITAIEKQIAEMHNRSENFRIEYVPAVKVAYKTEEQVGEMKLKLVNIETLLEVVISRNACVDSADQIFKETLFNRMNKIETFIGICKAMGAVFVLIGLPFLAWLAIETINPTSRPTKAVMIDKHLKVKVKTKKVIT